MNWRIFLFSSFCFLTQTSFAQTPLLFDDIHYYFLDRKAANDFFINNFGAKSLKEQPMNPVTFIDFLDIKNGQVTVNISGKGPFAGVKVGDPARWSRGLVTPQPNQFVYGQHWLAISTPNLAQTLKKIKKNGVAIASVPCQLPFEPNAKATALWGPDYSLVILVERKKGEPASNYKIDHIQMICEDVAANVQFYGDVLGAKLLERKGKSAKMQVAQEIMVFSEPEDLGLNRAQVFKKDRKKFFPGPDLFGFLYDEKGLKAAYENAVAKGYKFLMAPTRMNFFDKPTPYTFCILFSPDNFQIELQTEDQRTGPRMAQP